MDTSKANPGPGAYNLGTAIGKEGVKSTMTSRKGDTGGFGTASQAPGPGAYSPSLPRGAPAYRYEQTHDLTIIVDLGPPNAAGAARRL